jgi:hypothetical protein
MLRPSFWLSPSGLDPDHFGLRFQTAQGGMIGVDAHTQAVANRELARCLNLHAAGKVDAHG